MNREERNHYFNKWSQENLLAIEKEKDPAAILEDNLGEYLLNSCGRISYGYIQGKVSTNLYHKSVCTENNPKIRAKDQRKKTHSTNMVSKDILITQSICKQS